MAFYHIGETYKTQTRVYDSSGTLIDPASITCTITDPNGVQASTGGMTKVTTGVYTHKYDLPVTAIPGTWRALITTEDASTDIEIESELFYVVDRIYTTPQKVAGLMRLIDQDTQARLVFTNSTDPSLVEVERSIVGAMDHIDKATHHAWRARQITDEYYDIPVPFSGMYRREIPLHLKHRKINALVSGTDKIEIWDGDSWVDLVLSTNGYTEGRGDDYWIDYEKGIIYFVTERPYYANRGVRVSYRYGDPSVPGDIEEAATKLAAVSLLETDDYVVTVPEGVSTYEVASKADSWKRDVRKIISSRQEIITP